MRLQGNHDPAAHFYPIELIGGERGTRTLDLGIMRTTYRVVPVAFGATKHNEAQLGPAILPQEFLRQSSDTAYAAADESTAERREISKSAEMLNLSRSRRTMFMLNSLSSAFIRSAIYSTVQFSMLPIVA